MASDQSFVTYVCDQLAGTGDIRSRKMFGDYMVYVDDRPVVLVCDNTVYIKELPVVEDLLREAERGCPYEGAKEHYILDIDGRMLSHEVIARLLPVTPIPRSKSRKTK